MSKSNHLSQLTQCSFKPCWILSSYQAKSINHHNYAYSNLVHSILLSHVELLCAYHHVHLLHALCLWGGSTKVPVVEEIRHHATNGKTLWLIRITNFVSSRGICHRNIFFMCMYGWNHYCSCQFSSSQSWNLHEHLGDRVVGGIFDGVK